ncbi:MAG: 50S ribosomal protein L9 [Actinobacteria bacterium]|nr:50S ribosomal protein L9 [Actinomycetota bacterium]MCL5887929.1 50S ribosomal protein L9 [Actinomycetota bacterium]
MKVILLEEVKGKGGEGDVIEVARGFAVNYLLPNKMAIEATSGNLKQLEQRMRSIRQREEARVGEATALVDSLDGKEIVITVKVGDGGRLYGSVTPQAIADAVEAQLGVIVDRRRIDLSGQIKEVGEYEVIVQVYRDIAAHLKVQVTGESAHGAKAAPAPKPVQEEAADVSAADETAEEIQITEAATEEDEKE